MGINNILNKLFPNKFMKRLGLIFGVIFCIALVFFLLRGPYLSNSIKRLILPVLEKATGERIIIDKAVINLFPFYLQAKGFKIFDKDGNRLLRVSKMRAYIDLSGLLSKEIKVRRLTVKEPELTTDKHVLEKIIGSAGEFTRKDDGEHFSVNLKSLKITDGKFTLSDTEMKASVSGKGLDAEVTVKDTVTVGLLLKDLNIKLPDLPLMNAGLEGRIKISDKKIEVLEAKLYSSGSTIETEGELYLSPAGSVEQGNFSARANILMETVGRLFGLKQRRDGALSFSGSVNLVQEGEKGPRIECNLKTKGFFHLETLMELLKVNEHITGRISLDGEIKGTYPELAGSGTVKLEDAMLSTLSLDDVEGELEYKNKKFSIRNFVAHTYGGELKGNAFLVIPGGKYFVDAHVETVNSPQFFKFIKWDPPFPDGRVSGDFTLTKTPGRKIELFAVATYLNTSENRENLLRDRLRNIETELTMREGILTFNRSVLSTSVSELFMAGSIDLVRKKLNLNVEMESSNVLDITSPYFSGLKTPLKFTGEVTGPAQHPVISGSIEAGPGTLRGVSFMKLSADITYTPRFLDVRFLKVEQGKSTYKVSGSIAFRKATGLFSFVDPYYKAEGVIKDGEAGSLLTASYKDIPVTGLVNGKVSFTGDTRQFEGNGDIVVEDAVVFGQPVDRALINAVLSPVNIRLSSVEIYRNKSNLEAEGTLYFDKRFNAVLSSSSLNLRDLKVLDKYPADANIILDMKGSGTVKNPQAEFSLTVREGYFKKALIGKGNITGELKNKRLMVKGNVLDGIIDFNASTLFSETLPWDVNIEFKKGRYYPLLAGFLKDVPKDLSTSLEGKVRLKGKKKKFTMNAKFNSLNLSLYGYNFINKGDIILEFDEDRFKVKSFSISGRNGDITALGEFGIGKNYNFKIDGTINLTPLKALAKTIESLKGRGDFVIEIAGPWNSPELNGVVKIRNSMLKLEGLPNSIGPVNGDVFFDKDRFTFDYVESGFAGGKVVLSGVGYLEGVSLRGFSISSKMEGIRLRPMEDVNIDFDGKLFFETSPKRQNLTGDITVKRAKYEKRVEWKSWLLRIKEVQKTPFSQPSFLDKTVLNVHVTGRDNIIIDNNIARTPVELDLNVVGTVGQYGLIGRVEAKEGTIFFRNNEFEIIDGSVDFIETNRVVPFFHIQAATFTRGYRIRLNLDGPADKFDLSLFSDPPLSDMDIFTLLTGGQISRESKGIESGIGAGEATAFLTGRLQDVMEERFKFITGFERFEINPQTTTTGTVSPRITVEKRLLGQKLFVTYSTSIGTTEENIIKLQYNLNRNVSIIGLQDELGSLGADIKYRFEFR